MAASSNDAKTSLDIRTKSVEQTLIPLVTQVCEKISQLVFYVLSEYCYAIQQLETLWLL